MFYPALTQSDVRRVSLRSFGGLNGNPVIADGEFSAMENLSADAYPALTTRPPRGHLTALQDCRAMCQQDGLVWLDGSGRLHAGDHILNHFADFSDGRPRSLVTMGACVVVFPDKKWCNTARLSAGTLTGADHGDLEAHFETIYSIELTMCTDDAASYGEDLPSATPPDNPENGAYWLDISHTPRVLRQWSAADQVWNRVEATYVRLESPGIGAPFAVGDTVQLENLRMAAPEAVLAGQIAALAASPRTIRARGENYIVVDGLLDELCHVADYHAALVQAVVDQGSSESWSTLFDMTDAQLTALLGRTLPRTGVHRLVPDMDFVVEHGNRLWGCRYDGQINEIYASCLGDFTNWWRFDALASDAYRASRGAAGPFTGAVSYGSSVLFFRQRCLEKVYPSAAGAHQIVTTALDGVAPGCGGSLQIVDGVLYYLSGTGVMAYDGSMPVSVSGNLPGGVCYSAVAGRWQSRYYLSCRTDRGDHVLVYDTRRGLWHREDDTVFTQTCTGARDLYFADPNGAVWTARGSAGVLSEVTSWQAQTGLLGLEQPDHQYPGRIELRLRLQAGSTLRISAQYDDEPDWHLCASVTGASSRLFTLPIRPRRCAHLRLRLEGDGPATLFGITRRYELGAEGCRAGE